ncbi:MAG TPA: MinD/ParA family protein [bacterium]|nr:MinD/ParA family protein [bacterium]HPN31943.1 MinD/ParA family protein [bacterium]
MSKIISVHSFRGGAGKSNTTANLASLCAVRGLKAGVVDTDIQSPGIHVPFGLKKEDIKYSLNDFLWGACEIKQASYNLTKQLGIYSGGEAHLIPSSIKIDDITRVIHDGYDVNMLNEGFKNAIKDLNLDVLFIDTHPGLNDDTLLSIALSDALLILLRPDYQDYQGTDITVEIAKQLEVPQLELIVNKTPVQYDFEKIKSNVESAYNCSVAAVIPHSDDLMALASKGIFSLQNPDHQLTKIYESILEKIL